jgi:hypothetical protein
MPICPRASSLALATKFSIAMVFDAADWPVGNNAIAAAIYSPGTRLVTRVPDSHPTPGLFSNTDRP